MIHTTSKRVCMADCRRVRPISQMAIEGGGAAGPHRAQRAHGAAMRGIGLF